MKNRFVLTLIFIIFNLTACAAEPTVQKTESLKGELAVWTVYWDLDNGLKEFIHISDKLSSVSAFEAYFDSDGDIIIPEKLAEKQKTVSDAARKKNVNLYLTIVNDVVEDDGNIVQKDSGIIRKLLNDAERSGHIDDIIDAVKCGGYFGVEVDYEKIEEDTWNYFSVFCGELYERCRIEGIDLRVILEPKAPLDRYSLPDGPEYVMMAYNLYGQGTEPGPKADFDFIKALSEKMNYVSGKKWIAFSTGGFDWKDGGETVSVTETQVLELVNVNQVIPSRDEQSGCLYFYYTDNDGREHTVWYADNVTLDLWTAKAKECGYSNIFLWRLGGNLSATLEQFKENFVKYSQ